MNIAMVALGLLAYKMLKGNNSSGNRGDNTASSMLDGMLSEDAKSILGSIDNLTNGSTDKTGALLSLLTNPSVMSIVTSMFGGLLDNIVNFGSGNSTASSDSSTGDDTAKSASDADEDAGSGKQYDTSPYYSGSSNAHSFFAHVDNIAGQEVSSKLYHIYDNWYGRST